MLPLQWRQDNAARLRVDHPDYELSLLLEYVTGLSNARQRIHSQALTAAQLQALEALLLRRITGEPMAYLLGFQGFYDIELRVTPDTLIPRPDTEILVETALEIIPKDAAWEIADLGTGSGAIAIAVAKHRPQAHLIAVDKSRAALAVAAENAEINGVRNIRFNCGNWLEGFSAQSLHLILSNPPYIAADDPHLAALCHEPAEALIAADNGLADLKLLIDHAQSVLMPGGWLMLEHGWQQAAVLREYAAAAGWQSIRSRRDYGGNERITMMQAAL